MVIRRTHDRDRLLLEPKYSFILVSRDYLSLHELLRRHRRKQGRENAFKGLLRDMNPHHPPGRRAQRPETGSSGPDGPSRALREAEDGRESWPQPSRTPHFEPIERRTSAQSPEIHAIWLEWQLPGILALGRSGMRLWIVLVLALLKEALNRERVFSIVEGHTCWCSKGKLGKPVKLRVPVALVERSLLARLPLPLPASLKPLSSCDCAARNSSSGFRSSQCRSTRLIPNGADLGWFRLCRIETAEAL